MSTHLEHALDRIERLTSEQITYLRSLSHDQKSRMCSEIHRRVKAEMYAVVRRDVPYFTDEQVHDAVCAMLLTKATPECINVRSIEREVVYGSPDGRVCRDTQ